MGNVGKLPGGFVLMPDATIDNGRLEVVVAGWRGAAGFSQVATQVINPKLVPKVGPKLSTMERYLTTGIRVTTAKARPVQLDGDTDIEATHLIATVDPGVLRVARPGEHGALEALSEADGPREPAVQASGSSSRVPRSSSQTSACAGPTRSPLRAPGSRRAGALRAPPRRPGGRRTGPPAWSSARRSRRPPPTPR
ncbi:hypothetical protein [Brachybacterium sp. GPGPB12]|uniref:diacylglycerol/lipid kinase family protein n=1 Tax=Brachybacterium sp. GPGPB12 TaxID=3023517 RepID=UPI0031345810